MDWEADALDDFDVALERFCRGLDRQLTCGHTATRRQLEVAAIC